MAELLDLPGRSGGVGAALRPAVVQVEAVIVDQRGAVGGGKEEFREVGGPCEAVDRAAAEVEIAYDGTEAVAAFDAFVDLLVAFTGAGDQRLRPSMDVQLRAAWVLLSPVVVRREAFSQYGAVSAHDAFDCFGRIVQQVPGVGHLPGPRSTRLGSVAEGAGAVAAEHPHLGVVSQPGREVFAARSARTSTGGWVDMSMRIVA
ncbi:hypothetical protein [Streptomyces sp. ML-6]|uniref:hypothetical protein n=1 Tax=Streptomyces sp. ML-6 TaxID=2982693 RepID=UPI0024BF9A5E|nr:hypothetical protein [Streptomyces sp. ML-6]MDK0524110.1 hypothetical protein [Streptomyces sp. ML-6]